MKDETDVAALWARINEINCELASLSTAAEANILSRDAATLNADHEQRSTILRHQLAEVRAKLPAEGMATTMRLVDVSRALGEIILRDDPKPDYADDRAPLDIWDWTEA
jgi:hypothetical protein